jgi:hypothetical protein
VKFTIAGKTAQVCYGRPSARGRTMLGGVLPWGQLWRTGANEPTIIHIPFAASIAGINVRPGSYSLYTIPGPTAWTIIINRSTTQWGLESLYTATIQAQEAGRSIVSAETVAQPIEMFTIRTEPADSGAIDLILEWETTRVRIPIAALSD